MRFFFQPLLRPPEAIKSVLRKWNDWKNIAARLKWFTISEAVIMRAVRCGVQFKFNFRIKRYNYSRERRRWRRKGKKEFPRVVKHKNPQENPQSWRRLGNHKSNLVFHARITIQVHFNNVLKSFYCWNCNDEEMPETHELVKMSQTSPWTAFFFQRSLSICMCEKFVRKKREAETLLSHYPLPIL
jgi:hypothetical protein